MLLSQRQVAGQDLFELRDFPEFKRVLAASGLSHACVYSWRVGAV